MKHEKLYINHSLKQYRYKHSLSIYRLLNITERPFDVIYLSKFIFTQITHKCTDSLMKLLVTIHMVKSFLCIYKEIFFTITHVLHV